MQQSNSGNDSKTEVKKHQTTSSKTNNSEDLNLKLDTVRHSTAHVMAQAIQELFVSEVVQLGIGPTTENGFYYDIEMNSKLSEDHLIQIEKKMKEIILRKIPIKRFEVSRNEATQLFEKKHQHLKVELIRDFPDGDTISYYTHGEDFFDLCRGPHVENTGDLKPHFKLLSIAGAYWRGDQEKKMLQRIYAACFLEEKVLKEHLHFLEEAKKRDHRKLGKELNLFIFDPVAPASPFFMPKGAFIYNSLVEFMRRIYQKYNYQEVITPQVLDSQLWHKSGHYENYKENMYFTIIDEREFALKPMNCPCHMLMFSHYQYSYRELPLRFADFGRLHRYERSGVVAGLTRVRSFCQDDAHIFVPQDKIQDEILELMNMFFICYKHFGFDKIKIALSTRPAKKIGSDEVWDSAEKALESALIKIGMPFEINEGDGAFYGPKIDIRIADAINRYHQLGTLQLDFMLPERFDLTYVTSTGERARPVVIHRALLGSLERFLGVYIEHVAGAFPFWISPVQVAIVPVKNELHLGFAKQLKDQWTKLGLRVHVDERNESLGLKTRESQTSKTPFLLVIGDKEIAENQVTARRYGDPKQTVYSISEMTQIFLDLDLEKTPKDLRD